MRTGELLKQIPKATTNNPKGKNQHTGQNDTGVDLTENKGTPILQEEISQEKPEPIKTKTEIIKDLGFSPKQAERMQTLAEMRTGELLKAIPKAKENQYTKVPIDTGVEKQKPKKKPLKS